MSCNIFAGATASARYQAGLDRRLLGSTAVRATLSKVFKRRRSDTRIIQCSLLEGGHLTRPFRRISIALAFVLARSPAEAQEVNVRVDPRIELLSAVFRLAGRQEYQMTRVPRWSAAVDSHFSAFRDHPVVAMTRRLRFGFFIPMNLAIHLSEPPALDERSPFPASTSLHGRWTQFPDSTRAYLNLLRDFARTTQFSTFLASNRALADSARSRLARVTDTIDRAWIERFWGSASAGNFLLVAALTNGAANYGQSFVPSTGMPEAYAIIGAGRVDSAGFPLFDASDLPTILHEMQHPYVTPLIEAHAAAFREFGDSLYAPVAPQMRQQFYGSWDAMLNEALVRAAVPRYYLAHGDSALARRMVDDEVRGGFVWTPALVDLFGDYESNRASYPSMRDFMPRIVTFFRDWSQRR